MRGRDREALIEQAVSAYRPRDARDGRVRAHPAWLDLDEASRTEAFDEAERARRIEAALDPNGLSSTAKAVLARIRR
jgi:hypothetical protein